MNNDEQMRNDLVGLLRTGKAYTPFDQVVRDVPVEAMNRRPPNVGYTLWHLLEHMRIAQRDVLDFIRDPNHESPESSEWPHAYWPAPDAEASPADWQATIDAFLADRAALEAMVMDPETDLTAELPHAPGYTILREVVLMVDHNAYHTGEFAILRQVLDAWGDVEH